MRDAKEAANASKDAADVAKNSLELARQTAERQLRAYLMIKVCQFTHPKTDNGQPWSIELALFNYGLTPAYETVTIVESGISDQRDESSEFAISKEAQTHATATVAPSRQTVVRIPNFISGRGHFLSLKWADQRVYIWGRINYIDSFGNRHFTKFQMVHHMEDIHQFSVCEGGNGTDDKFSRIS